MTEKEYKTYIDSMNVLCRRCINYPACCGTGCSPQNILRELIDKIYTGGNKNE